MASGATDSKTGVAENYLTYMFGRVCRQPPKVRTGNQCPRTKVAPHFYVGLVSQGAEASTRTDFSNASARTLKFLNVHVVAENSKLVCVQVMEGR